MKRAMLCVFVAILAMSVARAVGAQAQPAVTLDVLNPVTPGTNVVVIVQGDPVQVQFSVSPSLDAGPSDLIQLRRLDSGTVVSEQMRGDLSGTASLDTSPSSAVGDLEVVYVLSGSGTVLATASETVRVVGGGPAGPSTVVVPSPAAPTIQAGINLVADGGTIRIGPGTYRERLLIIGKRVNLVGSGSSGLTRTLIAGPLPRVAVPYQRAQGLVSFGPGGGGLVSNLLLQGGDAGVMGFEDARGVPAAVQIKNAVIRMTGRGVLGTFSRLEIERVVIAGTRKHGVSVVKCTEMLLHNSFVYDARGAGLFVDNTYASLRSITIADAIIAYNSMGGIVISGGAKSVHIDNCLVAINWAAGIWLWDAGDVTISNTTVWGVLMGMIVIDENTVFDNLADGLDAFGSNVTVSSSSFTDCQRAGMIYDSSGGVITNTQSGANNRFGLVLQNEPKPEYSSPTNVILGSEQDVLTDGALPIPEAPPLP